MQKHSYALSILGLCLMTLLTDCNCGPNSHIKTAHQRKSSQHWITPSKVESPKDSPRKVELEAIEAIQEEDLDLSLLSPSSFKIQRKEVLTELKTQLKAILQGHQDVKTPLKFPGFGKLSVLSAVLASGSNPQLLQTFIDQGADVNYQESKLQGDILSRPDVLRLGIELGSYEAIKLLLDRIDIKKQLKKPCIKQPLIFIILKNCKLSSDQKKELCETLLVNNGVNINAAVSQDDTVLFRVIHYPGLYGGKSALEALLKTTGIEASIITECLAYHTNLYLTPWEEAFLHCSVDTAVKIIHCMKPDVARRKVERNPKARVDMYPEGQGKEPLFLIDSSPKSQIDRLAKYQKHHNWEKIYKAFLGIGITEDEIEKAKSEALIAAPKLPRGAPPTQMRVLTFYPLL